MAIADCRPHETFNELIATVPARDHAPGGDCAELYCNRPAAVLGQEEEMKECSEE
jgi:hypothetical protein